MKNIVTSIKLIIIGFLFCYAPNILATHVAGGTMTYRCLGQNRYEISMEFRRDCINGAESAPFDSLASFGVYDERFNLVTFPVEDSGIPGVSFAGRFQIPLTTNDTLFETLTTECNVISGDVCVQRTVYRDTIILPMGNGGYNIVYQRCCRNLSLSNIMDPLDTGATYWVNISERALEVCNSSPTWIDWPDIFICSADTLRYSHSAIDPDGDSLVYTLCTPSAGLDRDNNIWMNPPSSLQIPEVVWGEDFNVNNMFGGGEPLVVNPQTGDLFAVPPPIESQFLIGVCVEEYRNGELLSMVRRDFEYNIRTCGRAPVAIANPDAFMKCNSLDIEFANGSTSNFIDSEDLDYTWIFDYPNGTLTSDEIEPSVTYPRSGIYTVALGVSDGMCTDTAFLEVAVATEDDPALDFSLSAVNCNPSTIISLNAISSISNQLMDDDYIWTITANGIDSMLTGPQPEFNIGPDQEVTIALEINGPTGCISVNEKTIDVTTMQVPIVDFNLESFNCNSTTGINLQSIIQSPTAIDDEDILWTITTANNTTTTATGSAPTVDITNDQTITVTLQVTTPDGCVDTMTQEFEISTEPDPMISFDNNATNCNSSTVLTLQGFATSTTQNIDPSSFKWLVTTTDGRELPANGSVVNVDIGTDQIVTIQLQVTSIEGCTTTITESIQVTTSPFNPIFTSSVVCPGESAVIFTNTDLTQTVDISPLPTDLDVDSNGNFIVNNNTRSQTYNVTVSTADCQRTGSVTITVDSNPSFPPIQDIVQCGNETVGLNPNGPVNFVYDWSGPSGVTFDNTATNPLVSLESSGSFEVAIRTSAMSNCIGFDTVMVNRVELPTIDILPAASLIYCENDTITVSANSVGQLIWTDDNGNVISTDTEITLSGLQESELITIESITPEGCRSSAELEIQFIPAPIFQFDPNAERSTCFNEPISVSIDSNEDIVWTTEAGDIIFEGNTLEIANLDQDTTLIVTATNDLGCTYTDVITLTTFDLPTIAPPGSQDMSICIDTELTVSYDSEDMVQILDKDGNILSDSGSLDLDGLSETTLYSIILTTENGCTLTDSLTITVFEELGFSINNDDTNVIYCQGFNPVLNSSSNVDAEVQWFVGGELVDTGSSLTDFFPTGDFDIIAVAMDQFGCTDSDTISVIESIAEGAISGPSQLCLGEAVTLTYTPNIATDFNIIWTPDVGQTTGTSITVSPDVTTEYQVQYTNNNGCIDETSYTVLVGGFPDDIFISAEPQEVCLSLTTELSVTTRPNDEVLWSPADILDDPTSDTPVATPLDNTTFIVTITDELGCTEERSIDITVVQPTCDERDVFIPNTFTPNGDNLNDIFRAESVFLQSMELVIYNRWGQEVFATTNLNDGWDGTFEGSSLEPDVYGYYFNGVCVNGFSVQMQGNVTLVK